ncbi:MAG: hypothetical protein Kow0029_13200 [Candidatus Rifleibacteriota bacterium]
MKKLLRNLSGFVLCILVAISLAGCPSGGGGGGGGITPPTTTNPIHTNFTTSPAYVYQTGKSYTASVTVYETRGDEINFTKMYTYRTFADTYNSGRTANYYSAGPSVVYGWMFDTPGTTNSNIRDAYIANTSSIAGWTPNALKAYEQRTLSTTVMIGQEFQSKPAGFNGFFIPWETYRQWSLSGHSGVRYWVTLEGYDYKINDNYNLHIPIEIMFPANLAADGSVTAGTGGTNGTTDYDPFN